jgi:hypothetical protein
VAFTGPNVRQAAVQLFDKVFDGDTPPQLTASLVLMLLNAQTRAEPVEHLDGSREIPRSRIATSRLAPDKSGAS